ncbi:MAG: hypothetical protein RL095_2977 [Verrucomicrobiota bacterium]|jgi:nitroreductase
MNASDFLALAASRRSVKPQQFAAEALDDAQILVALEAANWAPSHGCTEPWRFAVFAGDGKDALIAKAAALLMAQLPPADAAERLGKISDNFRRSSHLVAVAQYRDPASKYPEWEELAATACAVQNFALALHASGGGSYWGTSGIVPLPGAAEALGFEAGCRLVGVLFCGRPAAPGRPFPRNSSAAEKTRWIRSH